MANPAVLEILIRARDEASKALTGVSGNLTKFSNGLKAHRTEMLAVSGAVAGLAVVSVNAASNMEEAVNKSAVTFGQHSDQVRQFAATSAVTFGISGRAANEYAGTLGVILNASGLAKEASAGMSVTLVKLAADLGSFNNIPIDVALEKLRAGLVGEVEPLRTVGVLLNQAAVEAKAAELGLLGANGELSEAAKVQARYALILEQTATQQGDFQRTSDSLANQVKKTKAQFEDTAAALGVQLIPYAVQAVNVLRGILNVFQNLSPQAQQVIVVIGLVAGGLAALGLVLPPIIAAFTIMLGPIGLVALAIVGIIAAGVALIANWDHVKDAARIAFKFVAEHINIFILGPLRAAAFAIRELLKLLGQDVPAWLEDFRIDADATFDVIDSGITKLRDSAQEKLDELRGSFNGITTGAQAGADTINTQAVPAFDAAALAAGRAADEMDRYREGGELWVDVWRDIIKQSAAEREERERNTEALKAEARAMQDRMVLSLGDAAIRAAGRSPDSSALGDLLSGSASMSAQLEAEARAAEARGDTEEAARLRARKGQIFDAFGNIVTPDSPGFGDFFDRLAGTGPLTSDTAVSVTVNLDGQQIGQARGEAATREGALG